MPAKWARQFTRAELLPRWKTKGTRWRFVRRLQGGWPISLSRPAIEEASILPFADALLAGDAENRINLNAPKRRMEFILHPEHAGFHRAIFNAGGRPGATSAALGNYG